MSTFGLFLLALATFVGILLIINDPTRKLTDFLYNNKKEIGQTDIDTRMEEWVDEEGVGKLLNFLLFVLLAGFYTFILEPIYVLHALSNNIGSQPIAYAMLGIIAISWIVFAKNMAKSIAMRKNTDSTRDLTEDLIERYHEHVSARDDNDTDKLLADLKDIVSEKKIKRPNPIWATIRRIFFALPTLYLLYLFLVLINVI